MPTLPGGMAGNVGLGSNFARARLLLAKRAGYLPDSMPLAQGPQGATEQWRSVSKNLAHNARQAGFANPMMFLRTGAQTGKLPTPQARGSGPFGGPLAYSNSALAMTRVDPRMLLRFFLGGSSGR